MTQPTDALEFLDADHRALHQLFQDYRSLAAHDAPEARRKALAEQICLELTIHARLEEEMFYPVVRDAIRDDDLMDEYRRAGVEALGVVDDEQLGRVASGR